MSVWWIRGSKVVKPPVKTAVARAVTDKRLDHYKQNARNPCGFPNSGKQATVFSD